MALAQLGYLVVAPEYFLWPIGCSGRVSATETSLDGENTNARSYVQWWMAESCLHGYDLSYIVIDGRLGSSSRMSIAPSHPPLRTIGLTMRYPDGRLAVEGLDLEVQSGVIFGLLGANGAGKTTTIKLLLGLLRPTAGRAEILGVDAAAEPDASRRRCAYVPELVALYDDFSGEENLRYLARLAGVRLTRDEALGWLRRVGLPPDDATRRVGHYSKGMRQKVGLAIALAREVRVLLLDEPLSGLDPQAAAQFCEILQQVVRERQLAVLMATHDLFRARRVCDRLGIMRGGRLLDERDAGSLEADELERVYLRCVGEGASA